MYEIIGAAIDLAARTATPPDTCPPIVLHVYSVEWRPNLQDLTPKPRTPRQISRGRQWVPAVIATPTTYPASSPPSINLRYSIFQSADDALGATSTDIGASAPMTSDRLPTHQMRSSVTYASAGELPSRPRCANDWSTVRPHTNCGEAARTRLAGVPSNRSHASTRGRSARL